MLRKEIRLTLRKVECLKVSFTIIVSIINNVSDIITNNICVLKICEIKYCQEFERMREYMPCKINE